jgi:hypothetical protein
VGHGYQGSGPVSSRLVTVCVPGPSDGKELAVNTFYNKMMFMILDLLTIILCRHD